MIFTGVAVISCWIMAAVCNAVMDTLAFHYSTSKFKGFNPLFWDVTKSWRNKYKNGRKDEGPKFFGSTTFLVFTTDAWHLFQFISNSLIIVSIVILAQPFFHLVWWIDILVFIGLKAIWGTVFELFYGTLLTDKI